jgi:lipopolysaccharide export system protein LptA
MIWRMASIAILALGTMTSNALPQEAGAGVVDIEASEMEILETDKRAIFRGDVVAKRPTDTIRCQEMIVNYIDVKQTDCKTAVTINTGTQTITGDLAIFQLRRNLLDVTGNVKVVQGKTVIRGPHLTVDLKTKRTKMAGGRVKGRFVPK